MIDKVLQVATEGENSKLVGEIQRVVDKDGEKFIAYQIKLKQHLEDFNEHNENLERCFGIIMGQCSLSMEQLLMGNDTFNDLKR